ncbi:MAG: glycosyltransferase family 39 protein [Chloroflexi bacterium]|nr:glycosyltransferase family 39 protein [Chloroflexota bacterium]
MTVPRSPVRQAGRGGPLESGRDQVEGTRIVPDEMQVGRRPVLPTGSGGGSGGGFDGGSGGGLDDAGPRSRLGRTVHALYERDRVVLLVLLALAALARLPGLAGRGDFDGDQGHDMLVLLRLVRDGQIPLLGPPTSIGNFHHGAAYYYLLAPFAWLSGGDPLAVLFEIALFGIAAVGVTWWLARAIGGRTAGAIAGLLLAVSPAAVEESTFIWNPNPIPFFAVVSLAAAWHARATGRARWSTLAVASAGMVVQLHVLGIVFLPPIVALGIAEAARASRAGDFARVRATIACLVAGFAVVLVLFVPLIVHELQTDFLETDRVIEYLRSGGGGGNLDPIERLVFTGLRIIGWPLVGLVTSAPFAAILTVSVALVLGIWLMIGGRGEQRSAARWLGFTVLWTASALSVLAPSLQTVVIGLPNDHYHAFMDPVVVILVALSMRSLAAGSGPEAIVDRAARLLASVALVALVALDVSRWPPETQSNGGWPAAKAAGERIVAAAPGVTFDVRSVPDFKSAEGIGFPIIAAGGSARISMGVESASLPLVDGADIVIVCDRLFEEVLGESCGGPAERSLLGRLTSNDATGGQPVLVEQFDASPRTSVSIYRR